MKFTNIVFILWHIIFLKNEDDAKDAVQDIFIKILQDIKDLKHPETFHIWSYQ